VLPRTSRPVTRWAPPNTAAGCVDFLKNLLSPTHLSPVDTPHGPTPSGYHLQHQLTDDELAEYFAPGYEGHGYEFKGDFPRGDRVFFEGVARALLGMANRPGGGIVILGVNEDTNHVLSFDGLSESNLESWNSYDEVSAALSPLR
jgi:hypothetical protein